MEIARGDGTGQGNDFGCTSPESTAEGTSVLTSCPLCREEFEVFSTSGTTEATCPACGLQFSFDSPAATAPAPQQEPTAAEPPGGDLDRWLAGDPIQPHWLNDRQRLWRMCRHRPYVSGLLASSVLAVLAVAVTTTALYCYTSIKLNRSDFQRQQAQQRHRYAESIVAEKTQLAVEKQQQAENEEARHPHSS